MEQEIYFEKGLGTRLRRLLAKLTSEGDGLYGEAGVNFKVGWFFVVYALHERGVMTTGELTAISGFSQPAVSQTVKKLVEEGIVHLTPAEDARQKYIDFTEEGRALVAQLLPLWDRIELGLKEIVAESGHDLMSALNAFEAAFDRRGIADRASAKRTDPFRTEKVEIMSYDARYKDAFRDLNYQWLEAYFKIEPVDRRVLSDPDGYILDKGGEIFFALLDDRPVGCVALKHEGDGVFEFTRFAVDPTAQGHGLGHKLMQTALKRFQARGGKHLFLDTNTALKAARALYDKYDWVEVPLDASTPYARANCRMVWQPPAQEQCA